MIDGGDTRDLLVGKNEVDDVRPTDGTETTPLQPLLDAGRVERMRMRARQEGGAFSGNVCETNWTDAADVADASAEFGEDGERSADEVRRRRAKKATNKKNARKTKKGSGEEKTRS
jgi:hypothetical protein